MKKREPSDSNQQDLVTGTPFTNSHIEKLADEAEVGFDVDEILARRGRRGRPRLGTDASTIESVRLDPEMKQLLVLRAEAEAVPVSEVIREALRQHLKAS